MARYRSTVHAAFLDLDGCLVDSSRAIPFAINAGLESVGLAPQPVDSLVQYVGPPLLATYRELLSQQGESPGRAEEAVQGYRAVYGWLARQWTTVVEGIPAALQSLRSAGIRLVVVTSKPRVVAVPLLEHVELLDELEEVVGPELSALTEPKQVGLERALHLVGRADGDRADTVMIGDTRYDIEAGHSCGTRTIGVTWGSGSPEELMALGADRVVQRPRQIPVALHDLVA